MKPKYAELESLQKSEELSLIMPDNAPEMEEAIKFIEEVIMKAGVP